MILINPGARRPERKKSAEALGEVVPFQRGIEGRGGLKGQVLVGARDRME
jgi:hypothetical protein